MDEWNLHHGDGGTAKSTHERNEKEKFHKKEKRGRNQSTTKALHESHHPREGDTRHGHHNLEHSHLLSLLDVSTLEKGSVIGSLGRSKGNSQQEQQLTHDDDSRGNKIGWRHSTFHSPYDRQREVISSWSLALSSMATSAEKVYNQTNTPSFATFHRMVFVEQQQTDVDSFTKPKELGLKDWLPTKKSSGGEELEDTSEDGLALKSSTVVWDKDQDCVPMSDWQDTFNVRCNAMLHGL